MKQRDKERSDGLKSIRHLMGARFTSNSVETERFGRDESFHPSAPPDAVVCPHTTEEVQAIVRICNQHRIPIIPYGVGTSLEGHVAALAGGITLDMSAMDDILAIHDADLNATAQPGVTRRQLNHALKGTGLFFSVDPGADATMGGMAATRASGTNTVRYGTIRENIISMEVVLADGTAIRTGRRAPKSAAGYDLTHLMVGSEGTLGVITELTVKLHPIADKIAAAVCSFDQLDNAVETVIRIMQYGINVARIELLDALTIEAINRYSSTDFRLSPTLFLEFHGSEKGVHEQSQLAQEIATDLGGHGFKWSTDTDQRHALWRARHDAAWAIKALRPDGQIWATDVCVPISQLSSCIQQTQVDLEENNLIAPVVGHVGDGNFHLCLLVDHNDKEEFVRAQSVHERMVMRALNMGGTCSGEHGIGYGKIEFLQAEHGAAVEVMKMIKQALDPKGIMNPGKLFV